MEKAGPEAKNEEFPHLAPTDKLTLIPGQLKFFMRNSNMEVDDLVTLPDGTDGISRSVAYDMINGNRERFQVSAIRVVAKVLKKSVADFARLPVPPMQPRANVTQARMEILRDLADFSIPHVIPGEKGNEPNDVKSWVEGESYRNYRYEQVELSKHNKKELWFSLVRDGILMQPNNYPDRYCVATPKSHFIPEWLNAQIDFERMCNRNFLMADPEKRRQVTKQLELVAEACNHTKHDPQLFFQCFGLFYMSFFVGNRFMHGPAVGFQDACHQILHWCFLSQKCVTDEGKPSEYSLSGFEEVTRHVHAVLEILLRCPTHKEIQRMYDDEGTPDGDELERKASQWGNDSEKEITTYAANLMRLINQGPA